MTTPFARLFSRSLCGLALSCVCAMALACSFSYSSESSSDSSKHSSDSSLSPSRSSSPEHDHDDDDHDHDQPKAAAPAPAPAPAATPAPAPAPAPKPSKPSTFQMDVEQYTVSFLAAGGSDNDAFLAGLGDLARQHGVSDWEASPTTWESIGRGLVRSHVSAAQRTAYQAAWTGGDAAKQSAVARGISSLQ